MFVRAAVAAFLVASEVLSTFHNPTCVFVTECGLAVLAIWLSICACVLVPAQDRFWCVMFASTISKFILLFTVSSVIDTLVEPLSSFLISKSTHTFCLYTHTQEVPILLIVLASQPPPPAGVAQVPSHLQNVVALAPVPEFKLFTDRFQVAFDKALSEA